MRRALCLALLLCAGCTVVTYREEVVVQLPDMVVTLTATSQTHPWPWRCIDGHVYSVRPDGLFYPVGSIETGWQFTCTEKTTP